MQLIQSPRIGAINYILWNSTAIILWSVATVVSCESFVDRGLLSKQTLTFIVSAGASLVGVAFYGLSVRRFRDLNLSGWLAKILSIPIPGLILVPYLCFVPGNTGTNSFGESPPPPGLGRILVTLLVALLAFLFFGGALRTYHATMAT